MCACCQGKALLGMVQAMQKTPEVFKGDNVLFVHTGGLFGLFPRVRACAARATGADCARCVRPNAPPPPPLPHHDARCQHRVVAKHAKGGSCSALEVPSASKL